MDRSSYGATAEMIGRITDPAQLTAMLRNPQHAGYTNVIIARLQEINHMRQAAQGAAPQPPTIAQQALQNAQQSAQPQGMARGGIVAFKDGGRVKRFADGGRMVKNEYDAGWSDWDQMSAGEKARLLQRAKNPTPATTGLESLYSSGFGSEAATPSLAQQLGPRLLSTGFAAERAPAMDQPAYDGSQAAPAADTYSGPDADRSANIAALQQTAPTAPLAPVSQEDLGLPSMGGGISSLFARSGGPRPSRKLADYTDEMSQVLGPNQDLAEARAGLAAQKQNAINNALMYAGLGMARAAGDRPQTGLLGSLATGATEGLTSYDKQAQERQQMLRDLGRQERAERMGILSAGVSERGQDVRADRQEQLQRMGLGLQAQALKAPALLEQAIRKRAVDLANADRAQGVQRPLSDYHLQAWQEYNSQLGAANVRADTARAAQRAAYITKMQQMNPSLSAQYLGQQFDAGAASGAPTGANYGSLE